jgi:hypothetical protein
MQPLSEQLPTRQKTDLHSSMADIHYIVSKLNAPPLNFNISLLSFRSGLPCDVLLLKLLQ